MLDNSRRIKEVLAKKHMYASKLNHYTCKNEKQRKINSYRNLNFSVFFFLASEWQLRKLSVQKLRKFWKVL